MGWEHYGNLHPASWEVLALDITNFGLLQGKKSILSRVPNLYSLPNHWNYHHKGQNYISALDRIHLSLSFCTD